MNASLIPTPAPFLEPLRYEEVAWVCWDVSARGKEARVLAINEHCARIAGGIALGTVAWRVRVRPCLKTLDLA
jgi:hypothetical protein